MGREGLDSADSSDLGGGSVGGAGRQEQADTAVSGQGEGGGGRVPHSMGSDPSGSDHMGQTYPDGQ